MAPADPLLNALRVPRQVVVDDERAELEVYPFCSRFGREHDCCFVAEMLDQRSAQIDRSRTGRATALPILLCPAVVDRGWFRTSVGAVEKHYLSGITVRLQERLEVF